MTTLEGAQTGKAARGDSAPTAHVNAASQQDCRATAADLAHVEAVVRDSGTSFYGAMRTLPKDQREAMYAVYAFCREIDDIADDPLPPQEKVQGLALWRTEIDLLFAGTPQKPTGRALLLPIERYGLRKEDFIALIDGMEMDASESLQGPDMATLQLYCERVAGAVGLLSIHIFGDSGERAKDVAWSLGQALQLTNILRDMREDADRGRLYLPSELIDKHGIASRDPDTVLAHPALPNLCAELASLADKRFKEAIAAMADCDRRKMRPAVVMMHVYHRVLEKLMQRGWTRIDEPVHVSKLTKIWIAVRYGLL